MKTRAWAAIVAMVMLAGSAMQWAVGAEWHDPWGPLEFLLGTWTGTGSGKPGESTSGATTFSYDLDRRILVRKNRAEYPPKSGETAKQVHEDLLIIYPPSGRQHFRAIYFDNEGHVINYRLSFPAKQPSVVFDSEDAKQQPGFRLVYETTKEGGLSVEFLIAPPGGQLKSYVKGVLKRP